MASEVASFNYDDDDDIPEEMRERSKSLAGNERLSPQFKSTLTDPLLYSKVEAEINRQSAGRLRPTSPGPGAELASKAV